MGLVMTTLVTKGAVAGAMLLSDLQERVATAATPSYRLDKWVVFVVVALALIVVFGVMTAWWITCRNMGLYPALDFPSFNTGGTFKAYCKA
jgi:hypothetical protein